jgi:hypothetical protein
MTLVSSIYFGGALAGAAAFAFKLRRMRGWGTPQLWTMCLAYLFAATMLWGASPSTIAMLNEATGIPNFTAVFVYCLNVAFAGTALSLAMFWRFSAARAWPRVRLIAGGYLVAIVAIVVLFAMSEVPVERQVDFMTFYANQPTVAAFLLIFAVATAAGEGFISYGCLKWARSGDYDDRPWLRRGLLLFGIATGMAFLQYLVNIAAICLAAAGLHWLDAVNTILPIIIVVPGMPVAVTAVVLPVWGPRLLVLRDRARRWRAFRTLRPMHRALSAADPGAVFVAAGKRRDPYHRVRRQLIELGDFRWTLAHGFDPAVADLTRREGGKAALNDEDLQATVEAAQLRVALAALSAVDSPTEDSPPAGSPDMDGADYPLDGTDVAGELARWLRVAKAWNGPVVAAVQRAHRPALQPAS